MALIYAVMMAPKIYSEDGMRAIALRSAMRMTNANAE
jgi:hypothetical protein